MVVDERSAAFFALGAAQATGTPVAMLSTSGTAAANFHPAVCEADESAVPLIVLTADRPPELRGIGAGQTIDQLKLYGDAVRWFCEVGTHDADDAGLLHYRSVACRAFWTAAGDPRPGPVHLNVAWRDPLGPEPRPEDVTATSPARARGSRRRQAADHGAARPAAAGPRAGRGARRSRSGSARDGLIVAGRMSAGAASADRQRWPRAPAIRSSPSRRRSFASGPHDRSLVVSAYEPIARTRPAALAPELVLRFGEMPTCKPLRQWLAELPDAAQLVIDPMARLERADADRGSDRPRPARGALRRARPTPSGNVATDNAWSESWLAAAAAAEHAVAAELERDRRADRAGPARGARAASTPTATSSTPPRACRSATRRRSLPSSAADVLFLANRGANGIDGLISSGIGAAAATERPAWIVTGDLGLFHDMNALAALRDTDVPVRIVCLNNDGGGIFEFLPQAGQIQRDEFEALLLTPMGLELERVAALYDLPHTRLTSLDQLAGAAAEPGLIEVPVDRADNAGLHARLSAAATDAVTAAVGL